ncbi:MAG TPA: PrsW family intramembrane metalloprotease [Actinomycetes bacterium]|nr:PrsW family intramembrane metalloprotease [Actinomycetes bacterium]
MDRPAAAPPVPTPAQVLTTAGSRPAKRPQPRQRWRPAVVLGAVMVLIGIALFLIIGGEIGLGGVLVGLGFAVIPVLPALAIMLWVDRYEPEPTSLLVFCLAWGTTVAALISVALNSASLRLIDAGGKAGVEVSAVFVAPWVEEGAKGAVILLIMLLRRREFDGIVDGIVFAGLVGLGFAFMENILYFGRAYVEGLDESGPAGALAATSVVFIIRGIAAPFAHPLFTAATGIGLGIAATANRPRLRVVAPLVGYLIAVLLHGLWNGAAVSGFRGFVLAYFLIMVPAFAGLVVLVLWARRREGRIVAANLPDYATAGWLSPAEANALASLSARRYAEVWARRHKGKPGRAAVRRFEDTATELAFLRERMKRGTAGVEATRTERELLVMLAADRADLA